MSPYIKLLISTCITQYIVLLFIEGKSQKIILVLSVINSLFWCTALEIKIIAMNNYQHSNNCVEIISFDENYSMVSLDTIANLIIIKK